MSDDSSTPPDIVPGAMIGDRYELIELIGAGGMGVVWRARQLNLNREVALKLLLVEEFEDAAEARRRFAREARVASVIKHPNVIEVYDVGEHQGLTYLAMELLRGISLRDRIADGAARLSVDFVVDIAVALAEALIAAHALGAVHRDLKPENIFLEHAGKTVRVVVLDFGLAFIESDEQLGRMTHHGVVMGTPHYLSPEQARGLEVGPPSDVYSLGCVLYELLTGAAPFSGSPLNVMTQHLYVTPDPVSARRSLLPRELDELTMAMLRKHPEQRPRISEVREQLTLLSNTLSGRRARGRDDADFDNRAARMISFSPTAPLPAAAPSAADRTAAGGNELRVRLIGEVSEDVDLGLLSNDMVLLSDASERADIILIASEGSDVAARVQAALASGLPVVAAIPAGDREAMGALARAGATEVTTLPLAIDNVVRALRRAKRRHDRRQRKSRK